ncbi:hypothetical protein [Lihuaxuella thermophila]|uniref:Uncharacterized protein n=1 Tax=Lihuaxuella thermophila TaxID=1173111 RepID=A0A1H8F6J0_9BACL|nr:hypothetical protein [Lihuaxuella thermophila]SEN27332.1 hypothetical protein SAMN05444955_10838 [Lihuaxuella thermophila]
MRETNPKSAVWNCRGNVNNTFDDVYWMAVKTMKNEGRYMVTIRCNQCGERFTLKGKMRKGKVETGFKRCLCNNESDFEIRSEKI